MQTKNMSNENVFILLGPLYSQKDEFLQLQQTWHFIKCQNGQTDSIVVSLAQSAMPLWLYHPFE